MKLSIAIPTYVMEGGIDFLRYSLDILKRQTFTDFEVVVSDNSDNDIIKELCMQYPTLHINYFKNSHKGMAQNTNSAIKACKGELIKILYQDDFLANDRSLESIVESFTGNWLVSGCKHILALDGISFDAHYPLYHDRKLRMGQNTIGSPSVLTIKNENPLLFDENMTWVLDCDYYVRLYEKYGKPAILDRVNVIIGLGKHQTTNKLSEARKKSETDYLAQKYQK